MIKPMMLLTRCYALLNELDHLVDGGGTVADFVFDRQR
jgi:hypothetical protein